MIDIDILLHGKYGNNLTLSKVLTSNPFQVLGESIANAYIGCNPRCKFRSHSENDTENSPL